MNSMNLVLLGATHHKNKRLSGCSYDILDNPTYADLFFYSGIAKFKQKMFMKSSDIVAMMIYLGEHTTLTQE